MASDPSPHAEPRNVFLAGIGHICVQWALLEQSLLLIIATAENMPLEKTYTRFGGLDMQPRLNMAIKLTREAKWPARLTKRIEGIRKAIQQEGGGLAERRNLFVHGVHADTEVPGHYELTMVRWAVPKRSQIVSVGEALELAHRLHQLAMEADAIFDDYGVWQFGPEAVTDRDKKVAQTKASARLIRAHNIKRGLKLILANLKLR